MELLTNVGLLVAKDLHIFDQSHFCHDMQIWTSEIAAHVKQFQDHIDNPEQELVVRTFVSCFFDTAVDLRCCLQR